MYKLVTTDTCLEMSELMLINHHLSNKHCFSSLACLCVRKQQWPKMDLQVCVQIQIMM